MGLQLAIKKMFTLNVIMIPSKIYYALFGAHWGSYVSFLNLFFISVGLTVAEAGLITGLMYAAPILTGPFWGYLADKTGYQRLILFVLTIGSSAGMFAMPWIAGMLNPYSQKTICNNSLLMNNTGTLTEEACNHDTNTLFWSLLGLTVFASIFLTPLANFLEALVSNIAQSGTVNASYGAQRFISMCITNFVVGKAVEIYSHDTLSPYAVLFYIFLTATLMFFPIGWILIRQLRKINTNNDIPEDVSQNTTTTTLPASAKKKSLGTRLLRLFGRFDINFFFLTVYISGTANMIFLNFTYLFINEELQRSESEMTYAGIIGILSEAFVFPFTAKIIRIVKYPLLATVVGTFAHFIRFLIMYMNVPFEGIIAAQALSGFAFALSLSSFFEQIHTLSPPELHITMKSVMLVVFMSGGSITANMAGGHLYQQYGPRKLFLFTSIVCIFWTAVLCVNFCWYRIKHESNTSKRKENHSLAALSVIENGNAVTTINGNGV